MLEKFYRLKKTTGISVQINSDQSYDIQVCKLVLNNSKLDFEQKLTGITHIQDLKQHVSKQDVLALNLNGRGILHKQLDKLAEINTGNFNQILPNASFKDFYVQNFISGAFSFVSVIRKEEAEKWLKIFKDLGFSQLMLTLGPFSVQHILPQLNFYNFAINFSGYQIQIDADDNWTSWKYDELAQSTYPIKIEQEPINEKLVLSYATAFQLLLADHLEVIAAPVPEISTNYSDLLSKRKLEVYGMSVLFTALLILLINFFLWTHFDGENKRMEGLVSQTSQSRQDLKSLEKDIKRKEAILNGLGWDSGINKAALLDQLAASLPEGITWNSLTLNPVDAAKSRTQRSLTFLDGQIRVEGLAQQMSMINKWMGSIKDLKWVKSVQLESYAFSKEENSGQFILNIKY